MKGVRSVSPGKAPDIRYADPTHEAFNAALEARRHPEPKPVDPSAPWMKPDVRMRLPQVHSDFEVSRNPIAQARIEARAKQAVDDQSGGTGRSDQDEPKPALKPKGAIRRDGDQAARDAQWMARQRDAVMAAAKAQEDNPESQETRQDYRRMPPVPDQ